MKEVIFPDERGYLTKEQIKRIKSKSATNSKKKKKSKKRIKSKSATNSKKKKKSKK